MESTMHCYASESVTEGHPDKMCDQISDAVLDEILSRNSFSKAALRSARVACETAIKWGPRGGWVVLLGEITAANLPDEKAYQEMVRQTIASIGYNDDACGFNPQHCMVMMNISQQSPNIAAGTSEEIKGAGDQGMMFGYATNETSEYMPLPITLAHQLTHRLAEVRRNGEMGYLLPDGKAQVTVEYIDGQPVHVRRVVIAAHHREGYEKRIKPDIIATVVQPVIPSEYLDSDFDWEGHVEVNGTGAFTIGGPLADAGLTGRKIIVDTYGGIGRHGGGAFSGKDPTKVDRSANYLARYVAKNVVAAGIAERCEFHLAYCIGKAEPFALGVNTFGTAREGLSDSHIEKAVQQIFPLRPADIIKELDLRRPIYRKTAAYGHFGRNDPDFTWERLDRVEALRQELGL